MSDTHYAIKAVAMRTGLTPHVIRVWERRYTAVKPTRTGTNRRLYSDADVERLSLLKQATLAGHSIGNIANLPIDSLAKLAAENVTAPAAAKKPTNTDFVEECLSAIKELNTRGFEDVLSRAIVALGQHGLLERLVGPLATKIGEAWREGAIMAAHEHFASAVIRNFLNRNSRPFALQGDMPTIVVATPSGQLHELGAIMVSAAANDVGWRVIYLGTSLPAAEIAGAAVQNRARAVALSIVYPEDDPNLPAELENLRSYLPGEVRIVVGGRAAEAYSKHLGKIGAIRTKDLKQLYTLLDEFRRDSETPRL